MSTKMFVNLPVKDLDQSMTFFKALGFTSKNGVRPDWMED
jgi:predicted lactoylglutathione lyase